METRVWLFRHAERSDEVSFREKLERQSSAEAKLDVSLHEDDAALTVEAIFSSPFELILLVFLL
jgi:hypothetical protein